MSDKKTLISVIITAIGCVALIGLGFWQIYRFNIKRDMLSVIERKVTAQPIQFNSSMQHAPEQKYVKYAVSGRFVYGDEMFLYGNHPSNPGRHGYFVFTPFVMSDGEHILVNRGWITPTGVDQFLRSQSTKFMNQYDDERTIVVVKMLNDDQIRTSTIHDNNKTRNIWFYVDLPAMGRFIEKSVESRFYMVLTAGEPMHDDLEIVQASYFMNIQHHHHVVYAIVWFALAIALVVMCVMHYNNRR